MKSFFRNFLIPNKNNNYKPRSLSKKSVVTFLAVLLLFEFFVFSFYIFNYEKNFSYMSAVISSVLIEKTNEEREEENLNELLENEKLNQAAKLKAEDMAAGGYFSHVSPDGKTPWYWLNKAEYDYELAGENLAINFRDSSRVHRAWMNSKSHRENILRNSFEEIGIATSIGTYKGKDAIFVVQYFAKPKATPQINTFQLNNFNQSSNIIFAFSENIQRLFLEIISSPVLLSDFVLLSLSFLVTLFLLFKIFFEFRIQHKKLIINGLVLILLMLLLLLINRYVFNFIF